MATCIGMAVYDTVENKRSELTFRTISNLIETVDFNKHSLIIVDNKSCEETQKIYNWIDEYRNDTLNATGRCPFIYVFKNDANLGTAKAINIAMKSCRKEEYFIKMDNDVIINKVGWIEEMEEVMQRMPRIGILGLKRKDVCESMYSVNPDQRSRLLEVTHNTGEKWYVVEQCKHIMGTCTMLSPELIKKVGFFYQMDGLYGFDDSLMCVRSDIAGFINCFMHGIDIDHIDNGATSYTEWKSNYAHEMILRYAETERMYRDGTRSIYYNPFEK